MKAQWWWEVKNSRNFTWMSAEKSTHNVLRSSRTYRVNAMEFHPSARLATPHTCLNLPQEFLGACRVFAKVVIKNWASAIFPRVALPLPSLIYVSVVAVATGYTAVRNQETRQDTVIVPSSSQNIIIFIRECVHLLFIPVENNRESVKITCFLQTRPVFLFPFLSNPNRFHTSSTNRLVTIIIVFSAPVQHEIFRGLKSNKHDFHQCHLG